MFLEYDEPHLDESILQLRRLVEVLNDLEEELRELSEVVDRGLEVDDLPDFRIRARLPVEHDLGREVLLEVEVLGHHAHMNGQLVEGLQQEVEPVFIPLAQDQVDTQDDHHDHDGQLLLDRELDHLGRPFNVIRDEHKRVFQVLNDHLRHLLNRLFACDFYELFIHYSLDAEHQVFHDIRLLPIFSRKSLQEGLRRQQVGHVYRNSLVVMIYEVSVLQETSLELQLDGAVVYLRMQKLQDLFEFDFFEYVLTLKVQSSSRHQLDHLLRPGDRVSAKIDAVSHIHLLRPRLYIVEYAECITLLLLILKGILTASLVD